MKSVGVSENGLWLIENAKTGEIEEFTDNMLSNDDYRQYLGNAPVSYTHLDVYKRQYLDSVIHIIATAQEPDGYLTTCVTNQCTRLSGWWGTHLSLIHI